MHGIGRASSSVGGARVAARHVAAALPAGLTPRVGGDKRTRTSHAGVSCAVLPITCALPVVS
jgi:hypothetical protein